MKRTISVLLSVFLVAALLAVPLAGTSSAWKPPSHLFGTEPALNDVLDGDGKVTLPGPNGTPIEIAANPTIVAALQQFPEAYRAGVVGPDAFPDTLFGQGQIHPDTITHNDECGRIIDGELLECPPGTNDRSQTFQWLRFLWEKAWGPAAPGQNRLENIAFALGYMGGHANGDSISHTFMNKYAHGVFPDFTDLEHADISIRHVVVEGYIDKHRPDYESKQAFPLEAPLDFIGNELILSNFSRTHSSSPIYDFFFDMQDGLLRDEARYEFDRIHQDCVDPLFPDCETETRQYTSDLGVTIDVRTEFCKDGGTCIPNPVDSPVNVAQLGIDAILESYIEAWVADIDRGLRAWPAIWEKIAQEVFAGKKPDFTVIGDQLTKWVLQNFLSMMGLPDFVGDGLYAGHSLISAITGFVSSAFTSLIDTLKAAHPAIANVINSVGNFIADARNEVLKIVDRFAGLVITKGLGITDGLHPDVFAAIDRAPADGNISPLEALRLLAEPEEYISDPHLFPDVNGVSVRSMVDEEMHLTAGTDVDDDPDGPHNPQDESFRDYDPALFAPMKGTITLARLAMLDEGGLNEYFKTMAGTDPASSPLANIYGAGTGGAPNNVMLDWIKSMDGEYQWRSNSPTDGFSYGTGQMWMFEDCVARERVMRTVFDSPVSDFDAFADTYPGGRGDDDSSSISDSTAPTTTLSTSRAPVVRNVGGVDRKYVGGATQFSLNASDNYWADSELRVSQRRYGPSGAVPPYSTSAADPGPFSLSGSDGQHTIEFFTEDGAVTRGVWNEDAECNTEGTKTESFYLDNTAPTVSPGVSTPNPPPGHESDETMTLSFTADDGDGAGVDDATAKHDVNGVDLTPTPVANSTTIDLFDYPATGLDYTYTAMVSDLIGNEGTSSTTWKTTVSHRSLRDNLDEAFARGCILREQTRHSLEVKLNAAAKSDSKGNDGASDNELGAFKNHILEKFLGGEITPYCATVLSTNATWLQEH